MLLLQNVTSLIQIEIDEWIHAYYLAVVASSVKIKWKKCIFISPVHPEEFSKPSKKIRPIDS